MSILRIIRELSELLPVSPVRCQLVSWHLGWLERFLDGLDRLKLNSHGTENYEILTTYSSAVIQSLIQVNRWNII